jgi:hypothetical protein
MTAFPPIATKLRTLRAAWFVLKAESEDPVVTKERLRAGVLYPLTSEEFVRGCEHRGRNLKAESSRRSLIDDKLELCWLGNRNVFRSFPP